jgi:hypothetical protein
MVLANYSTQSTQLKSRTRSTEEIRKQNLRHRDRVNKLGSGQLNTQTRARKVLTARKIYLERIKSSIRGPNWGKKSPIYPA